MRFLISYKKFTYLVVICHNHWKIVSVDVFEGTTPGETNVILSHSFSSSSVDRGRL